MPDFRVAAVLFDIDGTLLDSNGTHAEAWSIALHEHGRAVAVAAVRPLIGLGSDKFLPAVANVAADSAEGKAMIARKRELFMARLPGVRPTRGARDLVAFLHDRHMPMAVATSADNEEVEALLQQSGVSDLLRLGRSKAKGTPSKPDPDIVEAALAQVERAADETVLVGDTPYDIEAARRAGVRTIALRCGGWWPDERLAGAAAIFDDPAALVAHWRARLDTAEGRIG